MNIRKVFFVSASVLVVAAASVMACSSDDSGNPAPVGGHDSGTPNQPDTSTPVTPQDAGNQEDTGPAIDAALPDVGACASDSSTCNSCYAPKDDPVNGCSPYSANCVKFDNSRVPAGSQ